MAITGREPLVRLERLSELPAGARAVRRTGFVKFFGPPDRETTFVLDEALRRSLEREVAETGRSASAIARAALRAYFTGPRR
jgi:hypothetical protein